MTLRLSVSCALLALGCAGPALAAAAAAAGETTAPRAEASNPDTEIVCRVLKVTGSRLGATRTCLTKAQWRQARQDHRDETDRAQRQRYYTDPNG